MALKHAFRLYPVHPTDWSLLGYCWDNYFFVDIRLPFGSRSFISIYFQQVCRCISLNFSI